jgi:hypothetical protein
MGTLTVPSRINEFDQRARTSGARGFFGGTARWGYVLGTLCDTTYGKILEDHLPEDQANSLAQQCARNEPDARESIDKILADSQYNADTALCDAKARKASELVQGYVRREADAMTLVDKLLTEAGETIETFMTEALAKKLDKTERFNRLFAMAESRRNASLREIDRRRAVLGQVLRRVVQEIEDHQFEMIGTTPAKGSKAA